MEEFVKTFNINMQGKRGSVPFAQDILNCVREFKGSVLIEKYGRTVSANSLIGILSLGLQNRDEIKVTCYSSDEFNAKLCLEKIGSVVR